MFNDRKKLEGNGLWESSRFILPELKDRINEFKRSLEKQKKPELTEEEQHIVYDLLHASRVNTLPVTLTLFGEFENRPITGTVSRSDAQLRRVKVEYGDEDEYEWVNVDEIIRATIAD